MDIQFLLPMQLAAILFMLRHLPGLGPKSTRDLVQSLQQPENLFDWKEQDLAKLPGIGEKQAGKLVHLMDEGPDIWQKRFDGLKHPEVQPICFNEPGYPKALNLRNDMPPLLFRRGPEIPKNHRILAVVGTRNATPYGFDFLERLMHALRGLPVIVLSGMAKGIDKKAHDTALFHGLRTDAVVAHGPEQFQPPGNSSTGRAILQNNGAFWSEHPPGTEPKRAFFAMRNRIIAAMADAVLVVESGIKGGAMITAKRALEYRKPIFALPGLWYSPKSEGCNSLLHEGQAKCILHPKSLLKDMHWDLLKSSLQANLFDALDEQEKKVAELLQQRAKIHIDEMSELLNLAPGALAALLTMMELKGLVENSGANFFKWNWMQA